MCLYISVGQAFVKWFYNYLLVMLMLMVSAFVPGSDAQAVRVRALAGDTVLCSWARNITLIV